MKVKRRWRHGNTHRDRAQYVAKAVESNYDQEAKPDAAKRSKDWLHTDAPDHIEKQQRAEHERDRLYPGDRALCA